MSLSMLDPCNNEDCSATGVHTCTVYVKDADMYVRDVYLCSYCKSDLQAQENYEVILQ